MDNMTINAIAARNLVGEITMIKNTETRIFVHSAILKAPNQYWIRPSGNHPGHHPNDEHGDWGNLIHVKRTIVIAVMLAESENFGQIYKNTVYAGLIIHDLGKYGPSGLDETIGKGHPLLVRGILKDISPCPLLELIFRIAETHMGRWGETQPRTAREKVGHCADYIASRANIHIPVELQV